MATLTPAGLQTRTLTEWKAWLTERVLAVFPADTDISDASPFGQFIGVTALALTEQDEAMAQLSKALSAFSAINTQMNDLASSFQITRGAATFSTVSLLFTGIPGTTIPQSTIVKGPSGSIEWATRAPYVIPADGAGSVLASPPDTGPIPALAGTLSELSAPVTGVTSVINPLDATLGQPEESNAAMRARYLQEIGHYALTTLPAIEAAVIQAGCTYAKAYHNPTDGQVTILGWDFPAHTIGIVLADGQDSQIGLALDHALPAGIPTIGTHSVQREGALPFEAPHYFFRVVDIPISVRVVTTVDANFPAHGIPRIRDALVDYFNGTWNPGSPDTFDTQGIRPGDPVSEYRLATPINSVPGHTVSSVTVRIRDTGQALFTPRLYERFTLQNVDVQVVTQL